MVIKSLEEQDFGAYTCMAGNDFGLSNATIQLSELHTGTLRAVSTPDNAIIHSHDNARFNCTVEGMNNQNNLIWWHRNLATNALTKLFESNPTSQYLPDSFGGAVVIDLPRGNIEIIGSFDLLLKDVTLFDSGEYMCELVGLQNYSAQLTVVDQLMCSENLTDVLEGQLMNLSCSMNYSGSYLAWDVHWSNGDVKISSINYDKTGLLQRMVSFRTWLTDTGQYTCTVKGLVMSQSCQTFLTVTQPDTITSLPVEEETPPTYEPNFAMVGVGVLSAVVLILVVFLLIIAAIIKHYRAVIRRLRTPPGQAASAPYRNGSASAEQARPLTSRQESEQDESEL